MAVPISNVVRRIVFAPSGVGPYAFTFEILAATDIEVYKGDTLLTLTTDYTVTINLNGTGEVTLVATAGTDNITIVGARTIQRTTDFVTGGDLFANSLNEELDSLTIFTQQNAEAGDRSIRAPVTDPTNIDMTLPTRTDRAGKYLSFNSSTGDPEVVNNVVDITAVAANATNINTVAGQISPVNNISTVAGAAANISTVAGIAANVTTVAGIAANVTTVAGISADVTTVAADGTDIGAVAAISADVQALGPIAADIATVAGIDSDVTAVAADATDIGTVAGNIANVNTVAGISANVTTVAGDSADIQTVAGIDSDITTVAGIAANVTTVAGISANVTTVAGISADVTTVATNVADITNFSDVYLGPAATDPATRNDSSALQAGDLYFNTADDAIKVYTGSAWVTAYITADGFVTVADAQTITGVKTFDNGLNTDTISEETSATGVTIDGVLLKDSGVVTGAGTVSAPVYSTTGDTNTGIFFPAADTIAFAEGGVNRGNLNVLGRGLFRKADPTIVAWTKTGAFTATTATTLYIEVNGTLHTIASGTSITMPGSATTGTDYAIWCKTDGTLEATTNHTSPPTANARKVGGFHYAPGGNATGTSGGNTTAQINAYSMWDLKWRPACPDPRGMTLVAGGFWADIYLTGVDAITNGSSKYNVTMADGSSPPKVPTDFGGNGSTTYGSYTWFEAQEFATAFGKKCPTQMEFMSLAYGTTEASSIGSDQVSTILNAAYTSKWGVMQSAGVLYVWARDRGGPAAAASWNANTEGRGSEYNAPNAGRLGGDWGDGSRSGSRCSLWDNSASTSNNARGSRFVCDHLQLD